MLGTIIASVKLLIVAGFGAIRIKKIVGREDLDGPAKIAAIHVEADKIMDAVDAIAATTAPTWDDRLADVLSDVIDTIAENLIEEV